MPSVKEFIEKFEEQKPEKEEQYKSIKFYKTQSCHTPSKNDKPCEIAYEIDEDLEDDWIQNIKKGLNSISIHAPGIKFTKYSDVLDKIHPGGENFKQYRIKFKNIAENTTFTVGNIYNKDV